MLDPNRRRIQHAQRQRNAQSLVCKPGVPPKTLGMETEGRRDPESSSSGRGVKNGESHEERDRANSCTRQPTHVQPQEPLQQQQQQQQHNPQQCGFTNDAIKVNEATRAKAIDLERVQVRTTGLVNPGDADAKIKFFAAEALQGVEGHVFGTRDNRSGNELERRDDVTREGVGEHASIPPRCQRGCLRQDRMARRALARDAQSGSSMRGAAYGGPYQACPSGESGGTKPLERRI